MMKLTQAQKLSAIGYLTQLMASRFPDLNQPLPASLQSRAERVRDWMIENLPKPAKDNDNPVVYGMLILPEDEVNEGIMRLMEMVIEAEIDPTESKMSTKLGPLHELEAEMNQYEHTTTPVRGGGRPTQRPPFGRRKPGSWGR